jgi:hypothetical protein
VPPGIDSKQVVTYILEKYQVEIGNGLGELQGLLLLWDADLSIYEQQLYINVQRFWGGLVLKAHRLLYCSTLGSRVKNKKKTLERKVPGRDPQQPWRAPRSSLLLYYSRPRIE